MTVDNTQPKHVKTPKLMLVRFGRLGHLGWFEHEENQVPKVHTKVLIKTERGLELGEIVGPFCYKAGHFRQTPESVAEYFKGGGEDQAPVKAGEFVRFATAQDINEDIHLKRDGLAEMETAIRVAKEHHVPIDIVDVEHIFGGERIIFYFIAETRVDFRELVRLLAKEYQTRIEMRQIGSRDEARLMSDYENCGQECCCSRFMRILKPVNMRMAKLQKATLDPSKISGYCGRLKCCLRFEDDTYRDLRDRLPKRGTRLKTPEGMGTVIDAHILAQLVVLQTDDGRRVAIPVESLDATGVALDAPVQRPQQPAQAPRPAEREEPATEAEEAPVEGDGQPRRQERVPTDEIADDLVDDIESRYEVGDSDERGSGVEVEEEDETRDDELELMPKADPNSPEIEKKPPMKWAPVGNRPRGVQQNQDGGRPQGQGGGRNDNNRRDNGRGPRGGDQRRQGGPRDGRQGQGPQQGQGSQQGRGPQQGQGQGPEQGQERGPQQGPGQPQGPGEGQGQGGGRRRRNRRRNRHRGQGGQGGQPGQPGQGGGQEPQGGGDQPGPQGPQGQ
jgi:cell fate regulator YaaT (PSP1 superfamily)